jgi:hypothetical protein
MKTGTKIIIGVAAAGAAYAAYKLYKSKQTTGGATTTSPNVIASGGSTTTAPKAIAPGEPAPGSVGPTGKPANDAVVTPKPTTSLPTTTTVQPKPATVVNPLLAKYPVNTLLRGGTDAAVYVMLDDGKRHWVTGLYWGKYAASKGWSMNNVKSISQSELNQIPRGSDLTTSVFGKSTSMSGVNGSLMM